MQVSFDTRADRVTLGVQFRMYDGSLYAAIAAQYGSHRAGVAFRVPHPRVIACTVALAFLLCASGAVHAAGTHTVRSHTVSAHNVQAHTVASHTVREHTATNAYGTTYTVKAHTVAAHTVKAHAVRAYTVAAHTARNPVRKHK